MGNSRTPSEGRVQRPHFRQINEAHWGCDALITLNRLNRPFMTRKDRYMRAIRMTHRIYQLQDIHGWSNMETAEALDLIDEELPMHLSSASA